MSTRSTELSLSYGDARKVPWRQFGLAFLLTALALVLFAVTFAIAITTLNAGKVAAGTVVAGVPLGGLDRASAEVRLREELPSLSAGHLSVTFGPFSERVEYAAIGRDYDLAAMLDQAFAVGRDGDFVTQATEQLHVALRGATVGPRVKWDEAALEAQLRTLAAAAETRPVDASITRVGAQYVVNPSSEGTTVDVEAAWQQALAAVSSLSPADAAVSVNPVVTAPAVTTAQAQLAVDRAERVFAGALTLSGDGVTTAIDPAMISSWVRLEEAGVGEWTLIVERMPVQQFVAQQSASMYKAPVDASFRFENDQAVPVPGVEGRELDVETTTEAAYSALVGRADGAPVASVALTSRAIEPAFTTAQAIALAPRVQEISSWTTGFLMSERNFFGANILVPAGLINGTVVPAGAKFDFWATVGSLANVPGIGPGGAIINGRTNPTGALGGGICTCSTTLYNAASRAGLDMGARRNHAYYIDRYPTGLDATVWRSGSALQNMTFTNDTEYPIIVRGLKGETRAQCSGLREQFGSVTHPNCVVFEIWGVPSNRTVEFSPAQINPETVKVAKDFWEYADNKPDKTPLLPGEMLRLEYPTNGFQSTVVRTVRDAAGNIVHQDTVFSKYIRVHGVTLIGRSPGDPPAKTRVERTDGLRPIEPPEMPDPL